jgi:hypothetical protein
MSPFEHQRPRPLSSGPPSLEFSTAALQSASGRNVTLASRYAPVGRSTHLVFDSQPNFRRLRSRTDHPSTGEDTDNDPSSSGDSTASGTLEIETISGLVKKLSLRATDDNADVSAQNDRFHGNCSPVGLVEATRQFKLMHLSETTQSSPPRQAPAPQPGVMGDSQLGGLTLRRELWRTPHVSTS